MRIDPANIVGQAEIAAAAGVTSQAVSNWSRRNADFPAPIRTLRCGALYAWPEVEAWLRKPRVRVSKISRYTRSDNGASVRPHDKTHVYPPILPTGRK